MNLIPTPWSAWTRKGERLQRANRRPLRQMPPSGTRSGIEELRAQFRPAQVRWLFVGESSPAGGTHFYRANSNLSRATHEAFVQAYGSGRVPHGSAFLGWFRDEGFWLVDLADRPVNRMDLPERTRAVGEGVQRLSELIRQTQPETIVAVKASIAGDVGHAIAAADWPGDLVELPFPVRQWRAVYIRKLAAVLDDPTGSISATTDATDTNARSEEFGFVKLPLFVPRHRSTNASVASYHRASSPAVGGRSYARWWQAALSSDQVFAAVAATCGSMNRGRHSSCDRNGASISSGARFSHSCSNDRSSAWRIRTLTIAGHRPAKAAGGSVSSRSAWMQQGLAARG